MMRVLNSLIVVYSILDFKILCRITVNTNNLKNVFFKKSPLAHFVLVYENFF